MLSIVVIFHNMRREARRTLLSLCADYQRNIKVKDYEVIAIDNGSAHPLEAAWASSLGSNVRYVYHDTESVSPVDAINLGATMARGDFIAVIVDGARMASGGLVINTIRAMALFDDPAVFALSWHLGPNVQNKSLLEGYNQTVEDELLDSISWPEDSDRLFEISTLAQSSAHGFLGCVPTEFSWICVRRDTFMELGGYEEAFVAKGGGLVNHDFRNRLMSKPGITPVMLLGDGVFHQFHGGVATNVPIDQHPIVEFREEFKRIRGKLFAPIPTPEAYYFGRMPQAARKFALPK